MAQQLEQEIESKPLFDDEEMALRPVFTDFYGHLRDIEFAEIDNKDLDKDQEAEAKRAVIYGPNALDDSFFDRMRKERTIVGYIVGRVAARGALSGVLEEAELREDKVVSEDDLPRMIVSSLIRVRKKGEWDNSEESRTTRRELLAKGLTDLKDHPLITEAKGLIEMLRPDGHEAYGQDVITAVSKWHERVERKITAQTGDPAA